MHDSPLSDLIRERFDTFPPALKAAARFVLEHPRDVALLPAREQATRAGVSPAALTRLAQRLDLDGYEGLRRIHAQAMRSAARDGFAGRAEALVADRESADDARFVSSFVEAMGEDLAHLADPGSAAALARAADAIARARGLSCYGLRSSFAVAYAASYVMGLVGVRTQLVDGPGGIGLDRLRDITGEDVLLVVSVRPYARTIRQALAFARERGATTIAVTDDEISHVARLADIVVPVRIETPSFFHAMTPAFSAIECLAALVARRLGPAAPDAARRADAHLAVFGVYEPSDRD